MRRERARFIFYRLCWARQLEKKKEVAKLKLGQRATNIVGETNMIGRVSYNY